MKATAKALEYNLKDLKRLSCRGPQLLLKEDLVGWEAKKVRRSHSSVG